MKRISQLAIFLLSASACFGQSFLATVTGTITDPAGAVVPNAHPTSLRLPGATMETHPSTVSIPEVAILTSNFAPEFGTAFLKKCDKIHDRAAKRPAGRGQARGV